MNKSYGICLRCVSQNHTEKLEHTFFSAFMLNMSLITLSIILMSFDRKNNRLKKKNTHTHKRKYSNSSNKKMSKESKIDFFWTEI